MRLAAAIGIAFCLLAGVAPIYPARAQDCALKQLASVDLTADDSGLRFPASFDGTQETVALELERWISMVSGDFARAHDFRLRSVPPNLIIGSGSSRITEMGYAPAFAIGKLAAEGVRFLVYPGASPQNAPVAVIGSDFFTQVDLDLDMGGGKLNLFSADHCPETVVYWTKSGFAQIPFRREAGGYPNIDMTLNGKTVRAAIQTGAKTSSIGMRIMRQLFGIDETSPGMTEFDTTPGGVKLYHYTFKSLEAGGLSISNPEIVVFSQPPGLSCEVDKAIDDPEYRGHPSFQTRNLATCYGGVDMGLGLNILRKLRLYFASKENMLYITSAGAR